MARTRFKFRKGEWGQGGDIGGYEWDEGVGRTEGVLECRDEGDGGCGLDRGRVGWVAGRCAWRGYCDGHGGGYGEDGQGT